MPFLSHLFSPDGFMPHGCCYLWEPGLMGLHIVSDGLIALAYYSIPVTLIYFVRRRREVEFNWILLCFASFIVACGTTHLMEIWNIWHPAYWLAGLLKAATAAVSLVTAVLLVRLVPMALARPSPDQLRQANEALHQEVEERKQTTERAEQLNAELRAQTALLETSNQELESFSYTVSHDLRAPLRHIRGFTEIVQEEAAAALSPSAKAYLGKIALSAARMDTLIDDLLNFSRIGRAELRWQTVDTARLVDEVIRDALTDLEGRRIEWRIAPLPPVEADEALFRLVWTNLLSNAVKYTRFREEARIEVAARDAGDAYEFQVRDNGAGFDMQYVGKLFGIFQRLHEGQFEGTGVGLANVRRIVERHGGRTWAEGTAGSGAAFFFTMPKPGRNGTLAPAAS